MLPETIAPPDFCENCNLKPDIKIYQRTIPMSNFVLYETLIICGNCGDRLHYSLVPSISTLTGGS